MTDSLDGWIRSLSEALRLDPEDVDREGVLELARIAAHEVARPAAPLTTFLVGLAAGKGEGNADAFSRAAAVASQLAQGWPVTVETGSD
jgi:hypothetical protein